MRLDDSSPSSFSRSFCEQAQHLHVSKYQEIYPYSNSLQMLSLMVRSMQPTSLHHSPPPMLQFDILISEPELPAANINVHLVILLKSLCSLVTMETNYLI